MSFDQLIQLYFERSNALQSYWTVYVIVIGGLLAFSSLRRDPDPLTTLLLTVLSLMLLPVVRALNRPYTSAVLGRILTRPAFFTALRS